MGTAEEIDNRFLMIFTPESKAVFTELDVVESKTSGLHGGLAVKILKSFDQSSYTFCSCRAISHALHGSADQAVSALACG